MEPVPRTRLWSPVIPTTSFSMMHLSDCEPSAPILWTTSKTQGAIQRVHKNRDMAQHGISSSARNHIGRSTPTPSFSLTVLRHHLRGGCLSWLRRPVSGNAPVSQMDLCPALAWNQESILPYKTKERTNCPLCFKATCLSPRRINAFRRADLGGC